MAKEEKTVALAVETPFPLPVNEARGEVPLWVGNVPLVIAAEMGRLSAVSSRLQCKSLNDLFLRLSQVEVAACMAAVELLAVKGDVAAAVGKLNFSHFPACAAAFGEALSHHFDGDEGNVEAAKAA
jgi:hypothetical protein